MAPVDPDILNSNLKPLAVLGVQAGSIAILLSALARFYVVAHRALPPSKHTRSRHSIERTKLPVFLALGTVSTCVALFSRANWLVASFLDWIYMRDYPNDVTNSFFAYGQLVDGKLPLGLWWQDSNVAKQYFYGILGNPAYFLFSFQNLAGVIIFSLFVGIEGKISKPHAI
jgi:hypothetical protein